MTWMVVLASYFLPAALLLALVVWDWAQHVADGRLAKTASRRLSARSAVLREPRLRRW